MNSRHVFLYPPLLSSMLLVCCCHLRAVSKPHTVGLGPVKRVAHSTIGDPADASARGIAATDGDLKIRALVVDGQAKEWTPATSFVLVTLRRAGGRGRRCGY